MVHVYIWLRNASGVYSYEREKKEINTPKIQTLTFDSLITITYTITFV